MNEYNRGKRDMMLKMANKDLVDVASRIVILEDELERERHKKWALVHKITLLESDTAFECLEDGEELSLHEKIDLIKSNAFLS